MAPLGQSLPSLGDRSFPRLDAVVKSCSRVYGEVHCRPGPHTSGGVPRLPRTLVALPSGPRAPQDAVKTCLMPAMHGPASDMLLCSPPSTACSSPVARPSPRPSPRPASRHESSPDTAAAPKSPPRIYGTRRAQPAQPNNRSPAQQAYFPQRHAPTGLRRRPRNILWAMSDVAPVHESAPRQQRSSGEAAAPRAPGPPAPGLLARLLSPLTSLTRRHSHDAPAPQSALLAAAPSVRYALACVFSNRVVLRNLIASVRRQVSTAHKEVYVNFYQDEADSSSSVLSVVGSTGRVHDTMTRRRSSHHSDSSSRSSPHRRGSPQLSADCTRTPDATPPRRPSFRLSAPRAGVLAVRPPAGPLARPPVGRPRFFVPLSEEGMLAPWPRLVLAPPPVSNPLRRAPSNPDLVAPDSFLRQREMEVARTQARRASRAPPPPRTLGVRQPARLRPCQPQPGVSARSCRSCRSPPAPAPSFIPPSAPPRPQWRSSLWRPIPPTPARCALRLVQSLRSPYRQNTPYQ